MGAVIEFLMDGFDMSESATEVFALTFALLAGSTIFDLITQTFSAIYHMIGGRKR